MEKYKGIVLQKNAVHLRGWMLTAKNQNESKPQSVRFSIENKTKQNKCKKV